MALPLCQPLSRDQYARLCGHASAQQDFVFLGSRANAGSRGGARGFSSNATERMDIRATANNGLDTTRLAKAMETLGAPYQLSQPNLAEPTFPLVGGWVGHIAYEFGYAREPRLHRLVNELPYPLLFAGLYLWFASEDLASGNCFLWVHPKLPEPQQQQLIDWLEDTETTSSGAWTIDATFRATQTADSFRHKVEQVREYIQAGDCYQANLSQAFEGHFKGEPWVAFTALTRANPTPYAAFLKFEGRAVMSVSPERFLDIRNGEIRTSPIKGTRRRGTDPEQDSALADELLVSEKDRAENLMIVDLLRNDLSKSCLPGSVNVPELFSIEHYPNVHHMVSSVCGILRPSVTAVQLLRDCFPGGSITGAPKIRAMEIIDELEPQRRSIYCGSIGYISACGTMDTSITIRTLLVQKDRIYCWAGGGIVADSDIDDEYQESYNKVNNLLQTLEQL